MTRASDGPGPAPSPEEADERTRVSAPPGRRLWPRFSLAVAAFVLLLLSQEAFSMVIRELRTFEMRVHLGAIVAYIGFAVLAGFAFALAASLPGSLRLRHPRRALTLAGIPLLVTAFNLSLLVIGFQTAPGWMTNLALQYTVGLQTVSSVLLGVGLGSGFWDR